MKSFIRFFVVRDFQFLRWKPIKSPDAWRCLQWIDPSQTYQILKHYYQYLPHTSNPNQIPRRYQRKLPTNLSLWTATSWRGSICCTAVTQTKSRDMSVRDLEDLTPKLCRSFAEDVRLFIPKENWYLSKRFDNVSWMFLSPNVQHIALPRFLKAFTPATLVFGVLCFQGNFCAVFQFLSIFPRYRGFGHPSTFRPAAEKKKNNNAYEGC